MTPLMMLLVLMLLQLKHFVADFLHQPPWMYRNKGTYGHAGGITHAMLHGALTWFCIYLFTTPAIALVLALFDTVVHYHIDWAKMKLNAWMGWGPTTHEQFWKLLGLDQFLHQLTYLTIIGVMC